MKLELVMMNCNRADNGIPLHAVTGQSRRFRHGLVAALASACLLSACGGGGGADGSQVAAASSAGSALASTTIDATPTQPAPATPSTPAVLAPVTPSVPPTPGQEPAIGAAITDIRIQNTGAAQTNVPFTFGQVVAAGQMTPSEGLAARLADGTVLRLQSDIKATHADGSVRHVIVSGVLPTLAAGQTQTLQLLKSGAAARTALTPRDLAAAGLDGKVTITIDNVAYTASLTDAMAGAAPETWLAGTVASEWAMNAPLKNAAGATHPLLTARFDVRWFAGLAKQARVDVVIENNKTFAAGARNLTYDVNIELAGRSVYSKAGLVHYHHARWHQSAWWDAASAPAIHVQHNTDYLIATRAVSNYDRSVVPAESELAALAKRITAENTGPMTIGPLVPYMPTTGGRGDIGPLPIWSVMYLLSMDKRARDAMMAAADGSGTWSMHYRDERTGYPVRTDNEANKRISTHMNLAHLGPLPVPRCANNDGQLCQSPYSDDTAHQPSLAYLPYLLTGDHYYLEELQFWAASNPLGTDPNNSGLGQGLVRWQQVRAQAWSLRTLGHAAWITPDSHPLKAYFTKQLDNNLDFYNTTYVAGNPNALGAYDGSGANAFRVSASAPWQDDFLTWSFGYLNELGFTKALPILQWKAKYPVGRMTEAGYCWIEASAYHLQFRDSDQTPVYTSFAQLYNANFGGTVISNESKQITHPQGLRFIDQSCGSQAQADWLTAASGMTWARGRMVGYADSTLGYPANLQPALAVAAASGIPNAAQAWSVFSARTLKPDYSKGPQWAIVPR